MACDRCRDLDIELPIRSPGEISKAIRVVRSNIADRTLAEVPVQSPVSKDPFSALPEHGPWPDVVAYRFRCATCHAEFELVAETYHGSGGHWAPVRTA